MFKDRIDAGQKLARVLMNRDFKDGIVLAVPRGGVVVGAQVAEIIKLPLDIIIPKNWGHHTNLKLQLVQ
ncbi:hypothetical protein N752_24255 [Desulforamulus aquiferis]|nr:hypothetical protein [Desulforamulus aquiferis]RYD02446.1 hypothetical protein N752_24255 [Desulforamulus aquiferis]